MQSDSESINDRLDLSEHLSNRDEGQEQEQEISMIKLPWPDVNCKDKNTNVNTDLIMSHGGEPDLSIIGSHVQGEDGYLDDESINYDSKSESESESDQDSREDSQLFDIIQPKNTNDTVVSTSSSKRRRIRIKRITKKGSSSNTKSKSKTCTNGTIDI